MVSDRGGCEEGFLPWTVVFPSYRRNPSRSLEAAVVPAIEGSFGAVPSDSGRDDAKLHPPLRRCSPIKRLLSSSLRSALAMPGPEADALAYMVLDKARQVRDVAVGD